jgi:hypothetical protein
VTPILSGQPRGEFGIVPDMAQQRAVPWALELTRLFGVQAEFDRETPRRDTSVWQAKSGGLNLDSPALQALGLERESLGLNVIHDLKGDYLMSALGGGRSRWSTLQAGRGLLAHGAAASGRGAVHDRRRTPAAAAVDDPRRGVEADDDRPARRRRSGRHRPRDHLADRARGSGVPDLRQDRHAQRRPAAGAGSRRSGDDGAGRLRLRPELVDPRAPADPGRSAGHDGGAAAGA